MEEEERQRREAEEARLRAEEEERQMALARAKELEEQLERVSMHEALFDRLTIIHAYAPNEMRTEINSTIAVGETRRIEKKTGKREEERRREV